MLRTIDGESNWRFDDPSAIEVRLLVEDRSPPGKNLSLTCSRVSRTVRVALPFCHVTLKAARPLKIPQNPQSWRDRIKKRRLELGLYQAQLAEIVAVTESTVTNWEKNRTSPTLRSRRKVIEFLGYDPIHSHSETLGEKLSQYRKSRSISQKGLAHQIGIDPTTVLSAVIRQDGNRRECSSGHRLDLKKKCRASTEARHSWTIDADQRVTTSLPDRTTVFPPSVGVALKRYKYTPLATSLPIWSLPFQTTR